MTSPSTADVEEVESLLARFTDNPTLRALEARTPITPLDMAHGQVDAFAALATQEGAAADHARYLRTSVTVGVWVWGPLPTPVPSANMAESV